MTTSEDYRLYLEEKFKGMNTNLNAQFMALHDRLEAIEKQTTLTNSRVTHLEADTRCLKWFQKNWKATVILTLITLYFLFEAFSQYSIIELIKALS
jgi:hypothetical protein